MEFPRIFGRVVVIMTDQITETMIISRVGVGELAPGNSDVIRAMGNVELPIRTITERAMVHPEMMGFVLDGDSVPITRCTDVEILDNEIGAPLELNIPVPTRAGTGTNNGFVCYVLNDDRAYADDSLSFKAPESLTVTVVPPVPPVVPPFTDANPTRLPSGVTGGLVGTGVGTGVSTHPGNEVISPTEYCAMRSASTILILPLPSTSAYASSKTGVSRPT
jgi:hypothetical protein